MAQHHILVVDDEKIVRTYLEAFLEFKGYRVSLAENGAVALDKVNRERPSLVLLDLNMPVMDGIATLKAIRQKYPDLPVMIISGIGDDHQARQAIELGANDYIDKPFDTKYLELTLMAKLSGLVG